MKRIKFLTLFRRFRYNGIVVYYFLTDKRTPYYLKIIPLVIFILYLVFPFDLSPDFIPFLGWIDDAMLFPFLMSIALKWAPTELLSDCQKKAHLKLEQWKVNKGRITLRSKAIIISSILSLIAIGVIIWIVSNYPIF